MVARTVIPNRLTGGAVEHIRRNSGLSISTENRLQALEDASSPNPGVGVFLGGYNQVTDIASNTDAALLPASSYTAGDYYILTVTGVFSTPLPELNGQAGGSGDMLFSDGVEWILFGISTNYLSSVADDSAAGVITFEQRPVGTLAASAANEFIRKGESDTGDTNNANALSAHEGLTATADDAHGSRTYSDNAVSSHDGFASAHNGVLAGLSRENVFTATSQRMVFAASGLRFQEVAGNGEVEGTNAAGGLAALNLSGTAVNLKANGGNVLWQGVFTGQNITTIGFDYFDMANGELREQGERVVTEAPIDGNGYVRKDAAWDLLDIPTSSSDLALLYGDASNFTLNATPSVISNYSESGAVGSVTFNAVAGTITVNEIGVYSIIAHVIGQQGNSNKEESIFLWLRVAGGTSQDGDARIDHESVDTDKTDWRSVKATFTRGISEVPMILSLVMTASTGLGTFNIDSTTFEVHRVL